MDRRDWHWGRLHFIKRTRYPGAGPHYGWIMWRIPDEWVSLTLDVWIRHTMFTIRWTQSW